MFATTSCENSNPVYFDNDNPLTGFQFGSSVCISEYQNDTSTIVAGDIVISFFLFVLLVIVIFGSIPTLKRTLFK